VLQRCAENDWHTAFAHAADEFWTLAYEFLTDQVAG
jgi:hypothetical protein